MQTPKVQLIDAGTGNLQSVFNALQHQNAHITVVTSTKEWQADTRTILPGVGAFGRFMEGLQDRQFIEPILNTVQREIPLLGICVGMQAFFENSAEMGDFSGLGIIPGLVQRFPEKDGFKIPHTGWNSIDFRQESKIFAEIDNGSFFYFNHSYFCHPKSNQYEITSTDYILPFASTVGLNNIYGVQFHPEKSQKAGMQILKNFLNF
jgi:glutamine amidotransferase